MVLYRVQRREEMEMDNFSEWIQLAENGDKVMAEKVATMYMTGNGVEKNPEEAMRYFKIAAEQGSALGNYQLGRSYEKGIGVDVDLEKARQYYQIAADQDYLNAKNALAQMGTENENIPLRQTEPTVQQAQGAYRAPDIPAFPTNASSVSFSTGEQGMVGQQYSTKRKAVAIVLALFVGGLGIHNWYLGYKKKALVQALLSTLGIAIIIGPVITGVWVIVDIVKLATGKISTDAKGGILA